MKRFSCLMVLLLFSSIAFCQTTFQKTFPDIDKYVDSIMKDWNLPGVALGIVYKDQLIYGKGYGFRDVEQKLPVKSTTLFPIASNTKLLTATAAVMLAEEGNLSLDKPVRTYMPSLTFSNDELNAKVTIRDMLSHRTGLPRYDGIWAGTDMTRKEAISKVVYMKPQLGFRDGYIYNNMMYAAAGAVMENVTGKSWEELIREKIFIPLQMTASVFTTGDTKKSGDYSIAYFEPDSTRRLLPKKYEAQTDALGPAGTIKSSVEDMSHWMIAQLNNGMYNGKQVISAKAIKETITPNTIADKEGKYDELSNSLYALGRIIQTYKGYKIVSHTGSIDGFYSSLLFVPGQSLGVFMVHNGSAGGNLRSVMALPVVDKLLGLSNTPWSQRYLEEYKKEKENNKRAEDSIKATKVNSTTPSHSLLSYVGNYTSLLYGKIKIELVNNALLMTFRQVQNPLIHFHYDQFLVNPEGTDMPRFRLSFSTNNKGEVDKITMMGNDQAEVFEKK